MRLTKPLGKGVKFPGGPVSQVKSRTLAAVHAKNTKPEVTLRKALWSSGLRYRLHDARLPGRPDVILPRFRTAIFCDGDFWHGRDWERRKASLKVRRDYWIRKIESNIARDIEVNKRLEAMGWRVIRIWETEVLSGPQRAAQRIGNMLADNPGLEQVDHAECFDWPSRQS